MNGLTSLILLGTLFTTGTLFTGRYLQSLGTITGIVRDLQGNPISGVRVAALQTPEIGAVNLGILSSITTTDREGRYTLENVAPGRYYIAAGRVDAPTYFPGTQILSDAIAITVEPGYVISAIDFRINHLSVAVSSLAAVNGWARLAPYSDIIWTETSDRPFVLVDGNWAELYSINSYSVPQIIAVARSTFANQWLKRFEEDIVEVLAAAGSPTSPTTVILGLRDSTRNEEFTRTATLTAPKRSALMLAKGSRVPAGPPQF